MVQLQLLMCPILKKNLSSQLYNHFLTYVQCFDLVQHHIETGMPLLKRATHANGERLGDIIPISQLWSYINVLPHFGAVADPCLMECNSLKHSREFFLNKYFDKNIMFSLQC